MCCGNVNQTSSPEQLNSGGFHVLGFDVMFCKDRPPKQKKDAGDPVKSSEGGGKYCAHLLEVNCNPSLGIDSVYPCEGPAATRPVPPPASASWAAEWHEAMEVCSPTPHCFAVTSLTVAQSGHAKQKKLPV